jgi:hypothetical protein
LKPLWACFRQAPGSGPTGDGGPLL